MRRRPLDHDAFMGSLLHRLSVERLMITLGEALNKAGQPERDIEARVPDARQSIDFRHRIIDGYDNVDSDIVWISATRDVPILLAQINQVLVNENASAS